MTELFHLEELIREDGGFEGSFVNEALNRHVENVLSRAIEDTVVRQHMGEMLQRIGVVSKLAVTFMEAVAYNKFQRASQEFARSGLQKQRPNVYGDEPLIRTGKLLHSLTGKTSLTAPENFFTDSTLKDLIRKAQGPILESGDQIRIASGKTAVWGTKCPFASVVFGGLAWNGIRLRVPKRAGGRLKWIDAVGWIHKARMTQDNGFTIPARDVDFERWSESEQSAFDNMLDLALNDPDTEIKAVKAFKMSMYGRGIK